MIFVNIKNRLDLFDFICELIYQEWQEYYNIININSSDELITFYKNVFIEKNNLNQKYNGIFLLFNKINSINQLVGFITISNDDIEWYKKINKNSLFINEIYVLKKYRKSGYGKKIINFAIDYITNLNMKIYLSVEKLHFINYYNKIGFIEVDNYNLENQKYIIMEYKIKKSLID